MKKSVFTGGDFSHWNSGAEIAECEFFAQKLTESMSYVDATALERVKKWANSKPCILYHVIHPRTDVEKQFSHFAKNWNECHNVSGALGCAIDIECQYGFYPYNIDYCELEEVLMFAEKIESELKRRPVIYCGDYYCKKFYKEIRNRDYILWIARYAPIGKLKNICDMWQYTNEPYDHDYFFGSVKKLHSILKDW